MVIVSIRDFRSNQSHYLDMVNRGESVILRSRAGNDLRTALIEVKEVLAGNKSLQSLDNLIEEL